MQASSPNIFVEEKLLFIYNLSAIFYILNRILSEGGWKWTEILNV